MFARGQYQSVSTCGRFTDHGEPGLAFEQHTQASPHYPMVVNDQHPSQLWTRARHARSPLQRDVNTHDRTTVRRPFDVYAAAQGGGTLGDRAWREGARHSPWSRVIGDAEAQLVILTRQG